MSDTITYMPAQGTATANAILVSSTIVLNLIVLLDTANHVPANYGGAANAFKLPEGSPVGIGWTYDGTNFTSIPSLLKDGVTPAPTVVIPSSSLTRLLLIGS